MATAQVSSHNRVSECDESDHVACLCPAEPWGEGVCCAGGPRRLVPAVRAAGDRPSEPPTRPFPTQPGSGCSGLRRLLVASGSDQNHALHPGPAGLPQLPRGPPWMEALARGPPCAPLEWHRGPGSGALVCAPPEVPPGPGGIGRRAPPPSRDEGIFPEPGFLLDGLSCVWDTEAVGFPPSRVSGNAAPFPGCAPHPRGPNPMAAVLSGLFRPQGSPRGAR